jgi:outer membrane protein OmpA-like peptidoglycan-associated protein
MLVVAMATAVGCGGVSEEQYGRVQADATKSKAAAQEATAQVSALQSKVASLEQQNAALTGQVTELQRRLAATSAAKAELQEKQLIGLSAPLLFTAKSSTLTAEAKRTLDSMAEAVSGLPDKAVLVAGFTDDQEAAGKDPAAARWQLSTARALSVAKYLAGRGVNPAQLAVAGFGDARAVAPNDSLANRAQNRRAEITLVPANLQVGKVDVKPAALKTK